MEIKYEDIKKANETINTTKIKGKEYAEVNQRIKAFRMVYPTGTIQTEMISNENGVCIFKATIGVATDDDYFVLGTGTAYEKENSTFINKTSYIENCETSAVGRALGMAGFGIDTSVASAEEVQNAIIQQNQDESTGENVISEKLLNGLNLAIENNKLDDNTVYSILQKYGYSTTAEIKMKDYMNIVNELKPKKE